MENTPTSTPSNSSTSDTPSETPNIQVENIEPTSSAENDKLTVGQPDLDVDLGFKTIGDVLGMVKPDDSEMDKLQYIWDYFQKGRTHDEALDAFYDIKMKMAQPNVMAGETRLHQMYSYVRILNDIRSSEKEKKLYENK